MKKKKKKKRGDNTTPSMLRLHKIWPIKPHLEHSYQSEYNKKKKKSVKFTQFGLKITHFGLCIIV